MSQVSYGTITITDTNDIENIYMIYKGGDNNETPPSITWTGGQVDWTTDITTVEGNYIWAITVYKKSGIAITQQNYQEYFSDPVCLTGSIGRSVRSISTYYCNYGNGRPEENYTGWSNTVPVYDEEKPNYWIKTVIIYVDSTEEIITGEGTVVTLDLGDKVGIAKSLKVTLEPIQDLHGYDKPWSGGNGANKWDEEWEVGGLNGSNGALWNTTDRIRSKNYIAIKPSASYYIKYPTSGVAMDYCFYDANKAFISSGNTVNSAITTPTNAHYMKFATYAQHGTTYNHDIAINYPSSVTTYSPYSNICPISGRTECVTHRTGVNVWDEEWERGAISGGLPVQSQKAIRSKNFSPCLPNTTYFCKCGNYTNKYYMVIWWYDENEQLISVTWVCGTTATSPSDAHYFKISTNTSTYEYGTTYNNDISINYPSTDHEYHAYNGQTYTTDLGRTVYGGTLDVVSGVLTVDRAMVTFDGTENWYGVDASGEDRNRALYVNIDSPTGQYNWNLIGNYITPTGQADSYPQLWKANINAAGHLLIGIPKTITTIAEWKAYLAQNPLQLCYELATPQTIQLTPQEVQLLLGTNNVWSDGDVEVSSFTIAGQDVTIYKDNGLTEAVSKSFEASSKAQEALGKANIAQGKVTQIDTLLGGHFLWHGTAPSSLTKAGARVVEQVKNGTTDVSNTPSQWLHNVNIGADGIQLRYNEAVMAQLAATNSNSSDDIALKFYQPPTIGNTTTQGNLTMALKGNALTFYNPNDGSTPLAVLNANGLTLSKGGIVAGQALANNFVYLSTENYPLRQYTVTTDVAINNTKTYYTYNSETQRYSLVDTPDVSQISNYYEISNQGLTVNGHTPGDATNDPPWRQVIGSKFGVDASGTLYASGAVLSDTLTIQNKFGEVVASYGQTTIIGNKKGNQSYIEISDDGISFYGTGQPENPSARINGQYMYIPYTVVLNEMQVGQYTDETTGEERTLWSWKKMGNRNLRLVWLGGDSQ